MSEPEIEQQEDMPKKSRKPLLIGLVLALAGGGGGFYAVQSGMILGPESAEHTTDKPEKHSVSSDITFVPVDPMTISLRNGAQVQHLRFRAQLEVASENSEDVLNLLPRVVDVLNSYLAALELGDVTDPSALMRLRGQMLRRVQIVMGDVPVNDLLIMEFVLN